MFVLFEICDLGGCHGGVLRERRHGVALRSGVPRSSPCLGAANAALADIQFLARVRLLNCAILRTYLFSHLGQIALACRIGPGRARLSVHNTGDMWTLPAYCTGYQC